MKSSLIMSRAVLWSLQKMASILFVLFVFSIMTSHAQRNVTLASTGSSSSPKMDKVVLTSSTPEVGGNYIKYSIQVVKYNNNRPNPPSIANATVKLYNKYKNKTERAVTNADGRATLYLEPNTSYQITIDKKGYRPRFIKIDVKELTERSSESALYILREERNDMF